MISRRTFARALGGMVGAAKAMTPAAAAELAGYWKPFGYAPKATDIAVHTDGYQRSAMAATKAIAYLKSFGIPAWEEADMRRSAAHIHSIDHDIAIKCWSLGVKVAAQRKRNYERYKRDMELEANVHIGRVAIGKALGFDWPWRRY